MVVAAPLCLLEGGTGGGVADEAGVASEPAADGGGCPRFGGGATGGNLLIADKGFDGTPVDIDLDAITIFEEGDQAAFSRFRRDVADTGTTGTARETAIGDEGNGVAQTGTHDVGGGSEHLL